MVFLRLRRCYHQKGREQKMNIERQIEFETVENRKNDTICKENIQMM